MRKQFVIAILVGLSIAMVRPAFAQKVASKDDVANEALNAASKLDAQTAAMAANVAAATKQVSDLAEGGRGYCEAQGRWHGGFKPPIPPPRGHSPLPRNAIRKSTKS